MAFQKAMRRVALSPSGEWCVTEDDELTLVEGGGRVLKTDSLGHIKDVILAGDNEAVALSTNGLWKVTVNDDRLTTSKMFVSSKESGYMDIVGIVRQGVWLRSLGGVDMIVDGHVSRRVRMDDLARGIPSEKRWRIAAPVHVVQTEQVMETCYMVLWGRSLTRVVVWNTETQEWDVVRETNDNRIASLVEHGGWFFFLDGDGWAKAAGRQYGNSARVQSSRNLLLWVDSEQVWSFVSLRCMGKYRPALIRTSCFKGQSLTVAVQDAAGNRVGRKGAEAVTWDCEGDWPQELHGLEGARPGGRSTICP